MRDFIQNEIFTGIVSKQEYLELVDIITNKKDTVLISIHNPDSDVHIDSLVDGWNDVIQIQFWDVEESIGDYEPITKEQGAILKEFIEKNKDKKFLIHCAAGSSRSAGVGMAVECIVMYDGNVYDYSIGGGYITQNPIYSPNYTVYSTIVN